MPPLSVVEIAGRLVCDNCGDNNRDRTQDRILHMGFEPGYRITGLTGGPHALCRTCAALLSAALVLEVR